MRLLSYTQLIERREATCKDDPKRATASSVASWGGRCVRLHLSGTAQIVSR